MDTTTLVVLALATPLSGYLTWAYLDYRRMRGGRWW
jgi:hypothetical protein